MTLSWAVNSPLWSESGISSLYSFLLSDDHPLADCSYQMPVTDGQATCWDHIGWGHCPWALSRTFLAETRDPVKLDTIPHPDRKRLCRNARTFLYFKKGEPWCLAKGIIWPTKKENSRLSKEALRPLKFINRFLCVFFFWTEDSLKKYLLCGFFFGKWWIWPFGRNRRQGADYVGLKEPSSLFK